MSVHRGVFVTGTDTGVGKTVTSAALVLAGRRRGPVRYWKPVQTGIEADNDTARVDELTSGAPDDVFDVGVRLPRPVSPHLAARWSGVSIAVEDVVRPWRAQPSATWVVEGAGGVLVPLSDTEMMADLIAAVALPVVVAARTTLGTINHTLLTLETLRRRSLTVAGVVLVGEPNADNHEAIAQYGQVRVLARVPLFAEVTAHTLRTWLDQDPAAAGALAGVVA